MAKDINERETIAYIIDGLRKSRAAASDLAVINKSKSWGAVVKTIDGLLFTSQKLYKSKPQTRLQTLAMANKIAEKLH